MLGGPPTARRDFGQDESLALLAEIYRKTPATNATHVDVSVRLLAENGTEVFASRDSLANESATQGGSSTFSYVSHVPLKGVAPGRYALRLEARDRALSGDKPATAETAITVR
jgi:hypothetical protein